MLNLKEGIFIGAIGVSSLFSTGCQIDALSGILPAPGQEAAVPEISIGENIRVKDCVIVHDDPDAVLVITTSEHPIFIAADNDLKEAQSYLLREIVVTGKVRDVYPSINQLTMIVGLDQESVSVHLDQSFDEDEMKTWPNSGVEFSFYGRVIIVDNHRITIDSALKVEIK